MILPLFAMLQAASAQTPAVQDTMPVVTLADALQRAARLDPNYVAAAGQVGVAEWSRRAAFTVFIVPAVTLSTTATRTEGKFFTPFGTFVPRLNSVSAQMDARIDLFTGGTKLAGLRATAGQLEGARAGELQARLTSAMNTEADYYAVLTEQALLRVAQDQTQRAQQQFSVARARVTSGAAVQTDSLQLALGLTQARVVLLQQQAALRAAQLQLGRRIGLEGRADAAPVPGDSIAPALPFPVQDAVAQALAQGPAWRIARANERFTSGVLWARRAQYLPRASLDYTKSANDTKFFPNASNLSTLSLTVSLPLWDNGVRETQISLARANHDVAQAIRDDLERGAWHDVTAAYDAYETNRATIDLDRYAVAVARENNRVQETRYRAGATTILDLLDAQNRLVQAEADLVQAMYNTRLARAGLEVILGERINFEQGTQ
ncbi:MAG TPA: TolC family protein [Gemmatimonadales bacterium]|nr:TolC family protein [Gemmatimonadales bacterium]